jgi:hypothetical protein
MKVLAYRLQSDAFGDLDKSIRRILRAMAAHTKVGLGYNIQVAVDAKHKLIVEQAVTNQVAPIMPVNGRRGKRLTDVEAVATRRNCLSFEKQHSTR